MKYAPYMLGGVVAVAIAGALSGAAVGESPMLKRAHADSMPQTQLVTAANADLRSTERPPNHYPLETEDGTIEVAELALHGRLRSRGGDKWWERSREERHQLNAGYDFAATASPERLAHEERLLAFTGSTAQYQQRAIPAPEPAEAPRRMTRAEAPLALAEPAQVSAPPATATASMSPPPEPVAAAGPVESKTIDVAATLANRD